MKYFREKPYRIFYLGFFVLVYLSALVQTVAPLGSSKTPAYVPQKVKVKFGGGMQRVISGYFVENFVFPRGVSEGWMRNHGLVILDSASPTDIKVDLSFQSFSYGKDRSLRITAGKRVLKKVSLSEGWQAVTLRELMLEPGETLLYFYTPEGAVEAPELMLGENKEVSIALKDFNLEPVAYYTFGERVLIAKQRAFDFINHINYVYTSVVAFFSLLAAFVLHAYESLRNSDSA